MPTWQQKKYFRCLLVLSCSSSGGTWCWRVGSNTLISTLAFVCRRGKSDERGSARELVKAAGGAFEMLRGVIVERRNGGGWIEAASLIGWLIRVWMLVAVVVGGKERGCGDGIEAPVHTRKREIERLKNGLTADGECTRDDTTRDADRTNHTPHTTNISRQPSQTVSQCCRCTSQQTLMCQVYTAVLTPRCETVWLASLSLSFSHVTHGTHDTRIDARAHRLIYIYI